jgi:putative oxidoreductase
MSSKPGFMEAHTNEIFAVTRMVTGFLFLCHGAQKVLGLFGGVPAELPPLIRWTAGPIELVGGAMIAVGFKAGWAAFLCSGLMAAAYFLAHQSRGLLPIQNAGELAALYCFVFLFISSRGSGVWSIDARR